MRDDGRLGQPMPTDDPLDHECPVCDGGGDAHGHCFCLGLGVITAARALYFHETSVADGDADPRWAPRPLPPVPRYTGRRCSDCAFKADSLERDGDTAGQLFDRLARALKGGPFWCHAGMDGGSMGSGYVPRQRDERGAPIGHPICAGWVKEYERRASSASFGAARAKLWRDIDRDPTED